MRFDPLLDIGVIGIQGFGKTSLGLLQKRPDVRVAAVCDVNETGAREMAKTHTIPHVFGNYKQLVASGKINAVVIATPHFLHHPMTMAALHAGIHVFCEKPLALSYAEAREMAETAQETNLVLSCNYSKRQSFPVRALQSVVQSGRLGTCYHASAKWHARWTGFLFDTNTTWRTDPEKSGGGIFIGRGSHLLDALLYIFSHSDIASISAVTHNQLTGFPVEDYAQATLRLHNGSSLHLECSYVLPTPLHAESVEYEVWGTHGGAVYRQQDDAESVWSVGILDKTDGSWQDITGLVGEIPPMVSPIDSFVDAVLRGTPLAVSAESAAEISRILEAGYKSARLGREVVLEGTNPR